MAAGTGSPISWYRRSRGTERPVISATVPIPIGSSASVAPGTRPSCGLTWRESQGEIVIALRVRLVEGGRQPSADRGRVVPVPLAPDESNAVRLLLPSARSPEGDCRAIGRNNDRLQSGCSR